MNEDRVINYVVVHTDRQIPLLGLKDCIRFNLMKRVEEVEVEIKNFHELTKTYSNCFAGLESFPISYRITLKENICPKIVSIRRVSYQLQGRSTLK